MTEYEDLERHRRIFTEEKPVHREWPFWLVVFLVLAAMVLVMEDAHPAEPWTPANKVLFIGATAVDVLDAVQTIEIHRRYSDGFYEKQSPWAYGRDPDPKRVIVVKSVKRVLLYFFENRLSPTARNVVSLIDIGVTGTSVAHNFTIGLHAGF